MIESEKILSDPGRYSIDREDLPKMLRKLTDIN
jgi:hypothetical protein